MRRPGAERGAAAGRFRAATSPPREGAVPVISTATMPFGKHRGALLSELPGGYLQWLATKLTDLREPFRSALASELERRNGQALPGVVDGPPTTPAPRAPARRRAAESPMAATTVCNICGLGPTAQKPLVHASCLTDEVPF
jgi:Putative quorum-sensing-regulated virulence factor